MLVWLYIAGDCGVYFVIVGYYWLIGCRGALVYMLALIVL